jgi:4-hydroxyproline epimerase
MEKLLCIDSHTGGEPTRVVCSGAPDLGTGSMAERLDRLRDEHDWVRSAAVNEPRGSDVMVGAWIGTPVDPACIAGVIFFNNVGYLGMCGHGLIGLITTLAHLGRIHTGTHRIETPVGEVSAQLHEDGRVTVWNVPSYRHAAGVEIDVPGLGPVTGDVAWGGNWFFLVNAAPGLTEPLSLVHIDRLLEASWLIRKALNQNGFPEVDHVEFFSPPADPAHHSRNFVLCPGRAYDRSPCGTGTSAKLACLAAAGKLAPGHLWSQESIIGSVFTSSYEWADAEHTRILPSVTGRAHLMAETTLLLDPSDPFRHGITPR